MATASKTAGQRRQIPDAAPTKAPADIAEARGPSVPQPSPEPPIDIPDERDTIKRAPRSKPSGRRVRATPTHGGTRIEMRPEDWANIGLESQPLVVWDFLLNNFEVPVEELSEEGLEYLLEHDPNRFKVVEDTTE